MSDEAWHEMIDARDARIVALEKEVAELCALFKFEDDEVLNTRPNDPRTADGFVVRVSHFNQMVREHHALKNKLAAAYSRGREAGAKVVKNRAANARTAALHNRGLADIYPRRKAHHQETAAFHEALATSLDQVENAIRSLPDEAGR